jgi:hypothetical protein
VTAEGGGVSTGPAGASWRPAAAVVAGLALVGGGTAAALEGLEPFATWYYVFAWYGTLLVLAGWLWLRGEDRPWLRVPSAALALLGWSVVFWLFFELLNLRLQNWYYVFVPEGRAARWAGITISFATVLPAVLLAEAVLASHRLAAAARWRPLPITSERLQAIRVAGALMLLLPLVWPRVFYPLVWGAVTLLVEPDTFRRAPRRSLLGDLARGEPGRILRLLVAGAVVGLLWELYNAVSRSGWIYTVPGFEELKLFEMPVAGFLGFPVFALACHAFWQAVRTGAALVDPSVPGEPAVPGRPAAGAGAAAGPARDARRIGLVLAGVLFTALMLVALERWTIDSYTPRLAGLPAERLRAAGYDPFKLAAADPEEVRRALGPRATEEAAGAWIESARLATLRGIGSDRALLLARAGIGSVAELAAAEPGPLRERLAALGHEVPAARVRVWIRGARAAVEGENGPPEEEGDA